MQRQRRNFQSSLSENQPLWFWNKVYTINEARLAVGVGKTALRRRVHQLQSEYREVTPKGSKA